MARRTFSPRHKGGALLVTLAFVVLVTVAILAFVAHTQSALLTARTTVARVESENLTASAIEATISDLRLEMLAGSFRDTNRTDFLSLDPQVVRRRWAMVPARQVSTNLPAVGFENLVKQSLSRKNFYPGSAAATNYVTNGPAGTVGTRRASSVNTSTPSADGRLLSAARWDQVALASKTFPTGTLPDWIYVTRNGVVSEGTTSIQRPDDNSLSNTNYVIGRYAYQIYDVGGLLDLNSAGLPESFATNRAAKGGVQWADLTALGFSQEQVNELMDFRFSATRAYSDLPEQLRYIAERSGFLKPLATNGASDGFFYTRQDLIRFVLRLLGRDRLRDCTDSERAILASVTQDSRFLTSPSWNPPTLGSAERPVIRQETKGGNNARDEYDLFNPIIVTNTVTVNNAFQRLRYDSPRTFSDRKLVPAQAKDQTVLSRFPLDRLRMITRTAIADKDSDIYRFFGITRSSPDQPWVYQHGKVTRILRLSEVQSGQNTDDGRPREPDFLEVLKLAISTGSLGKSAGTYTGGDKGEGYVDPDVNEDDQRINYQLVQIFANLIDQFDEDGFPTEIQTEGKSFFGVENVPYLQRIKVFVARLLKDSDPAETDGKPMKGQPYSLVWIPEIWNPHDANQPLPADRPIKFRVIAETTGSSDIEWFDPANTGNRKTAISGVSYAANANYVELTADAVKSSYEPLTLHRPKFGVPSKTLASIDRTPPSGVEDWSKHPEVDSDLVGIASPAAFIDLDTPTVGLRYYNNGKNPVNFAMEYQDPSTGQWRRYSKQRIFHAGPWADTGSPRGRSGTEEYYQAQNSVRFLWFDPRTERFASYRLQERDADNNAYADNKNLRPDQGAGYGMYYDPSRDNGQRPDPDYGWTLGAPSLTSKPAGTSNKAPYAMGSIVQNTTASPTRYVDPDGILRPGDGYLASGTDLEGQMLAPGNYASRPIILNRPFRSVAEAGYAFRGTPYRSLDFFSEKSGDSNFLDFFCIDETPDDAITSARVSANTRNVKVIESLLRGTISDPVSGEILSDARAAEAAQALVDLTSDSTKGPFLNRSELVTRFLGTLPVPASDKAERIKRRREVFIRGLADSLETRTWNLVIDLIAQTGRIPLNKTSLSEFRVESERHVWVHLSIDRVTGKVLNLNIEPVRD